MSQAGWKILLREFRYTENRNNKHLQAIPIFISFLYIYLLNRILYVRYTLDFCSSKPLKYIIYSFTNILLLYYKYYYFIQYISYMLVTRIRLDLYGTDFDAPYIWKLALT